METKLADARNFLDLNGLNAIRQQSNETDKASKDAALKEAAQQFEAIFMQMLLKSMRKAQDVLEADSPFNSESTKFYRDMHDQQMAVDMSTKGTLGLSDLIVRQLGGDSDNFTPASVLRTDNHIISTSKATSERSTLDDFAKRIVAPNHQASNNRQPSEQTADISINRNVNSFEQPKDFVTALTGPAQKVQETLGVPFEVVIAQAALETGWGQKIIQTEQGTSSNNLFNIKADRRWAGDATKKETLEYEQGALVKKKEPFRVYESIQESINDYMSFLKSGERYQEALSNPKNVEHFLHGLQKAGYATDPNYAEKIFGTLRKVSHLLSN